MPYSPPDNDAVNFSEEGSYSPPSNDAVNFSEGSAEVTVAMSGGAEVSSTPQQTVKASASVTASGKVGVDGGVFVFASSSISSQSEVSADGTVVVVSAASASASAEVDTSAIIIPGDWQVAGYPFEADVVESTAKTLTLSAIVARYRLGQIRNVREAAEKVGVVVDDNGRFEAVDRSRTGNSYTVEPPARERPPRETADMLVADYSEERVSKQENKSEVELTLQRPASRDATGDEPSQTRGSGEWLLEFHSGAIATRRITPERQSAVETAKDVESLQLVLTAEQVLVLETSATHPDAVSVVEVPDGTNLAQDNSTDDRQTVEVTAPSGKEEVLDDGTYVVADWTSTRLDSDSYEVSLDLRPKA
jgi:hypothetical protein